RRSASPRSLMQRQATDAFESWQMTMRSRWCSHRCSNMDAPLKRLRRKRRIAVTLPHFLAGPAIVARTDFVMTIPHRIARKYSELYALRIFPTPLRVRGFEVAMAWPTRREVDPAIHWLRAQTRMLDCD